MFLRDLLATVTFVMLYLLVLDPVAKLPFVIRTWSRFGMLPLLRVFYMIEMCFFLCANCYAIIYWVNFPSPPFPLPYPPFLFSFAFDLLYASFTSTGC